MSSPLASIQEPARSTPIAWEGDLCIVGGSCTGVFAALRAARMGLSVAIVEQATIWGGMATAAQVNEWHSIYDAFHEQPIIGGLTMEIVERLRRRGCLQEAPRGKRGQFKFNSAELVVELDTLIREQNPGAIRPFLAARCVAAQTRSDPEENARSVESIIIEDKSGRRALRASCFIDASGDGDLLRHAGFSARKAQHLQPATLQALVSGLDAITHANRSDRWSLWSEIKHLAADFGYPKENSTPWFFDYPGSPELANVFGPRLHGVDGSDADQVTRALMDGRRHHRALLDMLYRRYGTRAHVVSWPHALGIRETWHACALHTLTADELLNGTGFDDSIACGTYPVDIHSTEGTHLYYLDGLSETIGRDGIKTTGRWRAHEETPSCYHIPLRSLLPKHSNNLIVAGRILDADPQAFGATRVMVNMNQTGEAAGVACALAVRGALPLPAVPPSLVRSCMIDGGSLLPSPATPAMLQSNPAPSRIHGFTLTELLTVIAIIGVLAAIIIPVVGSIRQKAKASECISNLRQIGMAMDLYATENRGMYPKMGSDSTPTSNSWYMKLSTYVGLPADLLGPPDKLRTAGVFNCPSFEPRENRATSYGLNCFISPSYGGQNWNYRRNAVINPSRVILVAEKNGNADQATAENTSGLTTVEFRHNHTANYLMADSHVKSVRQTTTVSAQRWTWW